MAFWYNQGKSGNSTKRKAKSSILRSLMIRNLQYDQTGPWPTLHIRLQFDLVFILAESTSHPFGQVHIAKACMNEGYNHDNPFFILQVPLLMAILNTPYIKSGKWDWTYTASILHFTYKLYVSINIVERRAVFLSTLNWLIPTTS